MSRGGHGLVKLYHFFPSYRQYLHLGHNNNLNSAITFFYQRCCPLWNLANVATCAFSVVASVWCSRLWETLTGVLTSCSGSDRAHNNKEPTIHQFVSHQHTARLKPTLAVVINNECVVKEFKYRYVQTVRTNLRQSQTKIISAVLEVP